MQEEAELALDGGLDVVELKVARNCEARMTSTAKVAVIVLLGLVAIGILVWNFVMTLQPRPL